MKQQMFFSALVAVFASLLTIGGYHLVSNYQGGAKVRVEHVNGAPSQSAMYTRDENGNFTPLDFTVTAEKVMDAVVHIRSTTARARGDESNPFGGGDDLFEYFFGPRGNRPDSRQGNPQPSVGEGSGVIISPDGFIVTNNHVVADADDIEVTLHDNRSYKARLIGADPNTDLAVIQIEEKGLIALAFSDSDKVKVGEWVMAVGNPFNLNSTVTAGIVSAKGRNINILREQYAVESFIQTDAAINPGNSGGALVNLNGGLIGINTAIASPTGSYSGYGFAVPANIVSKIVNDLIEYGTVQRGFLGVTIRTVDAGLARDKGLKIIKGVYVDSLMEGSSAAKAGVKSGDVIVQIDGQNVTSSPELQEIVARHRPGDQLSLKVNRNGAEKSFSVTLNNRKGNTELAAKADDDDSLLNTLGVELEEVPSSTAKKLGISGGLRVTSIGAGKIRKNTQMQEGFIITRVDGKPVATQADLLKALKGKSGGVMLEGKYEDVPGEYYYAFGM